VKAICVCGTAAMHVQGGARYKNCVPEMLLSPRTMRSKWPSWRKRR
jgi:hypothetical protein